MTDDLVQRLREMGEHPCRVDFPIGADLREAADRIEALIASNEQWQVDYNEGVLDNLQLQVDNARLREAVVKFDALIEHQYTGSQWAMSDMHEAAQFGWKVLQEQSK